MAYGDRLFKLLSELDDAELEAIWVDALRRDRTHEDFDKRSRESRIEAISQEWRAVHGHTVLNRARGAHELPWRRILIDVADKLKPGPGWTDFKMKGPHADEAIEAAILDYMDVRVRSRWDKMSPDERESMAASISEQLDAADLELRRDTRRIAVTSVTSSSLGAAIAAGLMSQAGALVLAKAVTGTVTGAVLGGVTQQVGFWVVARVLGFWSGAQMAATGGAATIGSALVSAPAVVALVTHTLMATSYRKTVPATLMLLTAHELRRQVRDAGG